LALLYKMLRWVHTLRQPVNTHLHRVSDQNKTLPFDRNFRKHRPNFTVQCNLMRSSCVCPLQAVNYCIKMAKHRIPKLMP